MCDSGGSGGGASFQNPFDQSPGATKKQQQKNKDKYNAGKDDFGFVDPHKKILKDVEKQVGEAEDEMIKHNNRLKEQNLNEQRKMESAARNAFLKKQRNSLVGAQTKSRLVGSKFNPSLG